MDFKHLQLKSIKSRIFNVPLNIVLFNNWKTRMLAFLGFKMIWSLPYNKFFTFFYPSKNGVNIINFEILPDSSRGLYTENYCYFHFWLCEAIFVREIWSLSTRALKLRIFSPVRLTYNTRCTLLNFLQIHLQLLQILETKLEKIWKIHLVSERMCIW